MNNFSMTIDKETERSKIQSTVVDFLIYVMLGSVGTNLLLLLITIPIYSKVRKVKKRGLKLLTTINHDYLKIKKTDFHMVYERF